MSPKYLIEIEENRDIDLLLYKDRYNLNVTRFTEEDEPLKGVEETLKSKYC